MNISKSIQAIAIILSLSAFPCMVYAQDPVPVPTSEDTEQVDTEQVVSSASQNTESQDPASTPAEGSADNVQISQDETSQVPVVQITDSEHVVPSPGGSAEPVMQPNITVSADNVQGSHDGSGSALGGHAVDGVSNNAPVPPVPKPRSGNDRCFEAFTYSNALMRAENAYVRRKYSTVIEILRPIYENLSCIDDTNIIVELELLLGVAYFEQGSQALADVFFMNVLRTEPDHIVGSVITLPETSARRIESLRAEHADELNKLREKMTPNTVIESLYILSEKEQHPFWINFLPFGAGLFQNHHTNWGATYAAFQVTGIAMTILGGGMVEYYRGDNHTFSKKYYQTAKNWQMVQIAGIVVLGVSYLTSVIHALVVHEDSTMIIHSPTQTRPDIAAVSPFIMPDGAGIAYGSTF